MTGATSAMFARVRSTYHTPDVSWPTGSGRFSGGGCVASQRRVLGRGPAPLSMTSVTTPPNGHDDASRSARVCFHCVVPDARPIAAGQSLQGRDAVERRDDGADRRVGRNSTRRHDELAFDDAKLNRQHASLHTAACVEDRPVSIVHVGHEQPERVVMGGARVRAEHQLDLRRRRASQSTRDSVQ